MASDVNYLLPSGDTLRVPDGVTVKDQLDRALTVGFKTKRRRELREIFKTKPQEVLDERCTETNKFVWQLMQMPLPVGAEEIRRAKSGERNRRLRANMEYRLNERKADRLRKQKKAKAKALAMAMAMASARREELETRPSAETAEVAVEMAETVIPAAASAAGPVLTVPVSGDEVTDAASYDPLLGSEYDIDFNEYEPPMSPEPDSRPPCDEDLQIFGNSDSDSNEDLDEDSSSNEYVGDLSDLESDEEYYGADAEKCSGHNRDDMQLIVPHKPGYCPISFRMGYKPELPVPTLCETWDDCLTALEEHCNSVADCPDDLQLDYTLPLERSAAIAAQPIEDAIFHISVPAGILTTRDDFLFVVYRIVEVFSDYWDFSMYQNDANRSHQLNKDGTMRKGNVNSFSIAFICGYERRFRDKRSTGSSGYGPIANCCGRLHIKYVKATHTIGIRHIHRPHKTSKTLLQSTRKSLEEFLEKLEEMKAFDYLPGGVIRTWATSLFHTQAGEMSYRCQRNYLEARFKAHEIDIISFIINAESMREFYGLFVFYSKSKVGLALYIKPIIAAGSKATTALSIDATYKTNRHQMDLLIANGCIDKTGVMMAMMFISNVKDIREHLLTKGYPIMSHEKPIYQCPLAAQIDAEVSGKGSLSGNGLTALTASFLCLLSRGVAERASHDTDAMIVDPVSSQTPGVAEVNAEVNAGANANPEVPATGVPRDSLPPYESSERVNPIFGDTVLEAHVFPGVKFKYILTDKHRPTISAALYSMPSSKILLCLWHVLDAIRRHVVRINDFTPAAEYLNGHRSSLPPVFDETVPFLSQKAFLPHDPAQCATHLGCSEEQAELCMLHNPTKLLNHSDPALVLRGTSNRYHLGLKNNILDMIRRHARFHTSVPAGFVYLGPEYVKCRYYTAEQLRRLCVLEMITFMAFHKLYANLIYFWRFWYEPVVFKLWTAMHLEEYVDERTNMIAEGNHSKVKRRLNLQGKTRLDEFFYQFHMLLYEDYMRRAEVLSYAVLHANYTMIHESYRISWVNKRYEKVRLLEGRRNASFETTEAYFESFTKYGTDALKFVCGCDQYSLFNIHLCVHIMNAIDSRSFERQNIRGIRYSVRVNNSVPYYTTREHGDHGSSKSFWNIEYTSTYLEFYHNVVSKSEVIDPAIPLEPANVLGLESALNSAPFQIHPHQAAALSSESERRLQESEERALYMSILRVSFTSEACISIFEKMSPDNKVIVSLKKLVKDCAQSFSAILKEEEIRHCITRKAPTIGEMRRYPQYRKFASQLDYCIRDKFVDDENSHDYLRMIDQVTENDLSHRLEKLNIQKARNTTM